MSTFPCLARFVSGSGQVRYRLGDGLVDRYLEFVAGRSRPNTLRAVAFDLKTFFTVVSKDPVEVTAVDVFEFLAHQRGDRSVVRLADRESGLSARTIARRLSSVSGLYAYLTARGDTPVRASPPSDVQTIFDNIPGPEKLLGGGSRHYGTAGARTRTRNRLVGVSARQVSPSAGADLGWAACPLTRPSGSRVSQAITGSRATGCWRRRPNCGGRSSGSPRSGVRSRRAVLSPTTTSSKKRPAARCDSRSCSRQARTR